MGLEKGAKTGRDRPRRAKTGQDRTRQERGERREERRERREERDTALDNPPLSREEWRWRFV